MGISPGVTVASLLALGFQWEPVDNHVLSQGQISLPRCLKERSWSIPNKLYGMLPPHFDYFLSFMRANGTLIFVNKLEEIEVSLSSLLSLTSNQLPILVTLSGKCLLGWLRTAWPLI